MNLYLCFLSAYFYLHYPYFFYPYCMKKLEKTPDLLERLHSFEPFHGLPDEALQWLIDKSNYVVYDQGEEVFYQGQEATYMQVIVDGEYVTEREQNGERRELGTWETGYVTGVLPFSRMKEVTVSGTALRPTYVLELHKDYFAEMVQVSYEMVQSLVAVMSTRIREFSQLRFQQEKLMALGKLSAGLAHELNNPASAMVRDAEELYKKIHSSPERFKAVITMNVTPEETDKINKILFSKIDNFRNLKLSLLEKEERKEEILDWLDDCDILKGDDIAETFSDFGLTVEEMQQIADTIEEKDAAPIFWWIESTLSLERLVSEIRTSADRIAKLVKAIKGYSHMDRGVSKEPTDVREGIQSTLTMLKHKWKNKSIKVEENYAEELPKVSAYTSELNQVWTNVIDNAIDAMNENGVLKISVYPERQYVCVDIEDTGSGISEENLTRIFEPFFTTKSMRDGTGMGLDIVKKILHRHDAEVNVESQVGKGTTFSFCFPAVK